VTNFGPPAGGAGAGAPSPSSPPAAALAAALLSLAQHRACVALRKATDAPWRPPCCPFSSASARAPSCPPAAPTPRPPPPRPPSRQGALGRAQMLAQLPAQRGASTTGASLCPRAYFISAGRRRARILLACGGPVRRSRPNDSCRGAARRLRRLLNVPRCLLSDGRGLRCWAAVCPGGFCEFARCSRGGDPERSQSRCLAQRQAPPRPPGSLGPSPGASARPRGHGCAPRPDVVHLASCGTAVAFCSASRLKRYSRRILRFTRG
jgi:hypothetical protein